MPAREVIMIFRGVKILRMVMGRKEIASKRKPKPPVKLVSCSPTSSRIH